MAYTVTSQPLAYSPAFNTLAYTVYDSTYAVNPDFKYVFDLYIDNVLVNTSKLYPRTGGYCIYDPAKIIQDYIDAAFNPSLTEYSLANTVEAVEYYVIFKTEYYLNNVLTTNTISTGSTKWAWNAAATFLDSQDLTAFLAKFDPAMTGNIDYLNIKETGFNGHMKPILDNEYRNASVIFRNSSGNFYIKELFVETNTGKQYIRELNLTGTSKLYNILHFGIGIPQLNAVNWNTIVIGPGLDININAEEDAYYDVQFRYDVNTPITKKLRFSIKDSTCQKNNVYSLAYQSPNGGFGYIPIHGRNDFNLTVAKQTYKANITYPINTKREHTVYNNQAQRGFTANTNWLVTQDEIEEVMDCLASPKVYLTYGTIEIPVTVSDATFKHAQKKYDKMVQYSFDVKYAYDEILIH